MQLHRFAEMSVLYIIGNGFDLEHGLPTSYLAFRSYAGESLSILEEYFSFDRETIDSGGTSRTSSATSTTVFSTKITV